MGGTGLGALKPLWDSWTPAQDELAKESYGYFINIIEEQFKEADDHIDEGDWHGCKMEIVDIISVAINLLRWLGCSEEETVKLIKERAEARYEGQVEEILNKYRRRGNEIGGSYPQRNRDVRRGDFP